MEIAPPEWICGTICEMQVIRKTECSQFDMWGKKFLVDVVRGLTYQIDEMTEEVLKEVECLNKREEDILKILKKRYPYQKLENLWSNLKKHKIIEVGVPSQSVSKQRIGRIPDINTLYLHMTEKCNLECIYCYAKTYEGKNYEIDRETVEESIDLLIEESREEERLNIIFFGGEPLLNFVLIQHAVDCARKRSKECGKKIGFGITTNATLLNDEIVQYLHHNKFGILVSIDGYKEVHNKLRPFKGDKGSYDATIRGAKMLIDKYGTASARVTVTHYNLHFSNILEHLWNLGFQKVTISVASGKYFPPEKDIPVIKKELEKIYQRGIEQVCKDGKFVLTNFIKSLLVIHQGSDRNKLATCSAGVTCIAVAPDGYIYPCHRFVGIKKYCMGNMDVGLNRAWQINLRSNTVENRIKCWRCWARYFCNGGCLYDAFIRSGEIAIPDDRVCELQQHLIKLAIASYSELKKRNKLESFVAKYTGNVAKIENYERL